MNWLVFHIASGHAFFTGVALIVAGAFCSIGSKPLLKRITARMLLFGAVAIAISSTPIPYWYYALAALVTCVWLASCYTKNRHRWAAFPVAAVWLVAALLELPYHFTPSLSPASVRSISIVGDSVTAGIGGNETSETWPNILAREHGLSVQDISRAGETASSALENVRCHLIGSPVLVVEIGGNDLLGSTTAAQFSRDLDALLTFLRAPDRQIVMFELPLPPFRHEYGRVQRMLADKHNIALVPKRVFLAILTGKDSTLDRIHLSQLGHQRMADCVWRLVRSAFQEVRPTRESG